MEHNYYVENLQYSDNPHSIPGDIYHYKDSIDQDFFQTIANLDFQNKEQNQFPDPFKRQEFSSDNRKPSQSERSSMFQNTSVEKYSQGKQYQDENDINASYECKQDEVEYKQLTNNSKKRQLSHKSINQSYSNEYLNAQNNDLDNGQSDQNNKLFTLSASQDTIQPKRRIPLPGQNNQVHNPYIASKNLLQTSYRTGISQQTSTQQDSARHTFDETDGHDQIDQASFEKENILQQESNKSQRNQLGIQQSVESNKFETKKGEPMNKDDASEVSIGSYDSTQLQASINELAHKSQNNDLIMKGNSVSLVNLRNMQKLSSQASVHSQDQSIDENTMQKTQQNLKNQFLQQAEINNQANFGSSDLQSPVNYSIQHPSDDEQENKQVIQVKLQNIINTNRNSCKAIVYCDQKRYEVRFSENDNAYHVAKNFLDCYNLSPKYQIYVQTEVQKIMKLENSRMQKYQYEVSKREKHSQYQFQPFNLSISKVGQTQKKDQVLFKMMIQVAGRKQYLAYRQNDTAEQLAMQFLNTQQLNEQKYFYQVASQIQENISKYMRIQSSVNNNSSSIQNFKIL